ncbi:CAP domain-containing protein [Rhodobacter sp. NSM]|uniref:CAP domain-containing protein n=1 Tax=Rhodobacter sp. NSM TaxID=3457501 RepID=UPI003FD6BFF3
MRPLLLSLLILAAAPLQAAQPCKAPQGADALRVEVIRLVSAERRKAGLPPLDLSRKLQGAAQVQACDNARRSVLSHETSNGSGLTDRLRRQGYRFRAAAENIARGPSTAQRVVELWMNSAGHRKNILMRGVHEAGVGIAPGKDGRAQWSLVLAKRK